MQHVDAVACAGGNICIANRDAYINGVDISITIGAITVTTPRAMYLGAINGGSASYLIQGDIIAFAAYNNTLTADQISAVATAMAAL